MDYLTSVSICKDENPYIIDFYLINKHLGVEKFLFFDREQDNLSQVFRGYKDVEVIYFPEPNRHHYAWAEGVKHLQGKTVWAQFIDIDQVVVPNPLYYDNIPDFLGENDALDGIALNWHTFGSNDFFFTPLDEEGWTRPKATYAAYAKRARGDRWVNNHIQSIVQVGLAQIRPWDTPHNCPMKEGSGMYNLRGEYVGGYTSSPPEQDEAFIAHYYTRSREEWENKLKKGRADTGTTHTLDPHWAEGYINDGIDISAGSLFDIHNSYMNEVEDLTVSNIWSKVVK